MSRGTQDWGQLKAGEEFESDRVFSSSGRGLGACFVGCFAVLKSGRVDEIRVVGMMVGDRGTALMGAKGEGNCLCQKGVK